MNIITKLKNVLAKIYEIAGFEDENIDTERSEEKASPNIID